MKPTKVSSAVEESTIDELLRRKRVREHTREIQAIVDRLLDSARVPVTTQRWKERLRFCRDIDNVLGIDGALDHQWQRYVEWSRRHPSAIMWSRESIEQEKENGHE